MGIIGEAFVALRPETSGFGTETETKLKGMFGGLGGPVAALAGVGLAVGATLLDVGEKFQESYNTIITKTGATGTALTGLEKNFRDVFSTTPGANFKNVADALSEVEVRTHLAGVPLEDLTRKFVELGKITKTDVAGDVQSATALFNNFGVAAKNQSGELDVLYKASQQSGVGITDLITQMQKAAPTAQILGLGVNQTAALVAQLTEAGLPAQKVMMGLGAEFAKAAKAGKDPTSVIGEMVDQLKAAPNATVAATEAVKDFGIGARQAATLVDAVRSGALNFGATLGSITSGSGGIAAATEATLTLGDRFKLFRNEALTAIEPVAAKVLAFADTFITKLPGAFSATRAALAPLLSAITGGFTSGGFATSGSLLVKIFTDLGAGARVTFDFLKANIPPTLDAIRDAMFRVVEVGKQVFGFVVDHKAEVLGALAGIGIAILTSVVPPMVTWALSAAAAAASTIIAAAPFIALGAVLAAVGYGIVYAYTHFKIFRDIVNEVGGVLKDVVVVAFREVVDVVQTVLGIFDDLIHFVVDIFTGKWGDAFGSLGDIAGKLLGLLGDTFGNIVDLFTGLPGKLLGQLASLAGTIGSFFEGLPGKVGGWLLGLGKSVLDAFTGAVVGLVKALPGMLVDVGLFFSVKLPLMFLVWVLDADKWLLGVGVKILTGLYNDAVAALPVIGRFFQELPGKILDFIGNAGAWLIGVGLHAIEGLYNDFVGALPTLGRFFTDLPGKILGFLGDAATWLIGIGGNLIDGLIKGIEGAVPKLEQKLKDTVEGPLKKLGHIFGFSPSPLFAEKGANMIEGLVLGITGAQAAVQSALSNIPVGTPQVAPIAAAINGANSGAGAGATGGATLDTIAALLQSLMNWLQDNPSTVTLGPIVTADPVTAATETVSTLKADQYLRTGR